MTEPQDKQGRFLRRCVWCAKPVYGTACKEHADLDKKLRQWREGIRS